MDQLQDLDRIVLTGFMGSGKTTVGRLLAGRLAWRFVDLDQDIELREGRSVPEIFAAEGEVCFRRLEAAALVSLLKQQKIVLALGGGAPETSGNQLLLEQAPRTTVVHLDAPFAVLVERCHQQKEATERPVLANMESAAARFELRHRVYERIADLTIETSALDAAQTVERIIQQLHS